MEPDLREKVVLITGASGGIGSATARAFAAEGARLVLHAHRQRAQAEALARELAGTESLVVAADLRRPAEVARVFAAAVRRFGRVDTLVANAGAWETRDVPLETMSLAQWNRTLATVATSAFLCLREFFHQVRRQRRGNAVLVGSTAAVFGEAGHADYAAAKAALAFGLTRTLKNEIARLAPAARGYGGGRVNCVCPGWTIVPRGWWRRWPCRSWRARRTLRTPSSSLLRTVWRVTLPGRRWSSRAAWKAAGCGSRRKLTCRLPDLLAA